MVHGKVRGVLTLIYCCDASFTESSPTIGNRKTGSKAVTEIGSASVIQKTAMINTT